MLKLEKFKRTKDPHPVSVNINCKALKIILLFLCVFLFAGIIVVLRNPDPLVHQIIYTEDGKWVGSGLTYGWSQLFITAKLEYFVFINIVLLFIATKLNFMIAGNTLTQLPVTIAFISYSFFAFMPTILVFVIKRYTSYLTCAFIFLWILLIPLGGSQNEIIGRLSNIGYYMPFFVLLLLFIRSSTLPREYVKLITIDLGIVICAATNPLIYALSFVYMLWDFGKDRSISKCLSRNLSLCILLGILAIFLLPKMYLNPDLGATSFNINNLIEVSTARSIIYPFIFPFYNYLNNTISLLLTLIWIIFVYFGYRLSRSVMIKRLMIFTFVTIIIYTMATIVMRPSLTTQLSNYHTTFPDRYFMGINIFVILQSMLSFAEMAKHKLICKGIAIISLLYIFYINIIGFNQVFQFKHTLMPIQIGLNFREQMCKAKQGANGDFIIPTYFTGWTMQVPPRYVSKSNCTKLKFKPN